MAISSPETGIVDWAQGEISINYNPVQYVVVVLVAG